MRDAYDVFKCTEKYIDRTVREINENGLYEIYVNTK